MPFLELTIQGPFASFPERKDALERSYLRSSLEEMTESIKDSIQETVNAVLGEV